MHKEYSSYRRNGKLVYIKQPEYEELFFTSKLWKDEETMKDIGGIYNFTKNKWESFYKKMIYPTDGRNFYCLIYTTDDKPVGEVSFHGYDPTTKIARSNIKIHHKHRNKGYGEEAMRLMLEYYFYDFEGEMILDKVKNNYSKNFASKLGFQESGIYQNESTFKLSKKNFSYFKDCNVKNVSFIVYENIDITNYTLFYDILNWVNNIEKKKIFDLKIVSLGGEIKFTNNLKLEIESFDNNISDCNIMILPNSLEIDKVINNQKAINIINNIYNQCNYICSIGNSIAILEKIKSLTGIYIPNVENIQKLLANQRLDNIKLTNKNFIDNGKIMIACNLMGVIDMILSIILKVSGKEVVKKIEKKLGIIT